MIFKTQNKTRKVFLIKEISQFSNYTTNFKSFKLYDLFFKLLNIDNFKIGNIQRQKQFIIFERKREVKYFVFPQIFSHHLLSKSDKGITFHWMTQVQNPLFVITFIQSLGPMKIHSNNLCQRLQTFHFHWLRYLQSIAWLIVVI